MRYSRALMLAGALLGLPLTVRQAPAQASDTLLVSQSFTTRGEFIRLMLRGGDVYRVELGDPTQTRLAPGLVELRPVQSGVQRPRIRTSMAGDSYEIEVFATAEYEVSTRPPAGRALSLKLYWDADRTAKRHKKAAEDSAKAQQKAGE